MALGTASKDMIGWAAGLFEGEGTIGFYCQKCTVSVCSTDRDVLDKFLSVVGLGYIEKSPKKERASRLGKKDLWVWKVVGFEKTQAIVAAFWLWLGNRRRERCLDTLAEGKKRPVESKYRGYLQRLHNVCINGHEMTDANKYVIPASKRVCCVACRKSYMAERYQRVKGARSGNQHI